MTARDIRLVASLGLVVTAVTLAVPFLGSVYKDTPWETTWNALAAVANTPWWFATAVVMIPSLVAVIVFAKNVAEWDVWKLWR